MKKRFTEERIVRILQKAEWDVSARNLCHEHKISEQTYYRRKNKYGVMVVPDAKRLKTLECENSELKPIVAEEALDIRMLKEVISNKF